MPRYRSQIMVFLFIMLGISISMVSAFIYEQQSQNVTQTIKNTKLWVNSFDATRNDWATNGSSPYLNAEDEPTNHVYADKGSGGDPNDQMGDFGFENHSQIGTIISVMLRVYGRAYILDPTGHYFQVYLWDGTSWNVVLDFQGDSAYVWKEVDVSLYLDTWEKINGAKIYIEKVGTGRKDEGISCDAALLVIDYQ